MAGEPAFYDVTGALKRLGLDVEERDGEGYRRCPGHFGRTGHEDSSPSWSINLTSGLHHCFSCGYGGNLPHLVSGMLRLDHDRAEAWLADPALLAAALEARLRPVKRSMLARGAPADLAGYTLPPADALAARRISVEAALRYEVLWDGKGFVLPIRDGAHQLLGYQLKRARFMRNRPRGVEKSSTLFGLAAFTGPRIILVESPLDCARLWTAGIDGALASFGSSVSREQIELLIRTAGQLVLALDDDESGRIGAETVENTINHRMQVRRFAYPRPCGKDPGELDDAQIRHGIENADTRLERLLR